VKRLVVIVGLLLCARGAYARLDPGTGPLRDLPSPAGPGIKPRLSVTPSGRVLLSWLEPRPAGRHQLRMAWLDGSRWSIPVTIVGGDSLFANWADFPGVQPRDDRNLVAYWPWRVNDTTYGYHVRSAFSSDGGRTWSPPMRLHRDTSGTEHGFVSLVSIGKTDGMAVWLDGHNFLGHAEGHGPGPDMAVHGARITASGFTDERVIDPRACDCCQTAATVTSRGVLVAYRDRSSAEIRDISIARYENGRWSAPTPLHADGWHLSGCPVNGPALAASGNHVAVAWFTAAADTSRVQIAFSRDGGEHFGAPVRIDVGHPIGRVGVALLPDTTALATWIEGSGEGAMVQMRRISPAAVMSDPVAVARTSTARATGVPQLAIAPGRVIVAWTEAAKPSLIRLAVGSAASGKGR